MKTKTLLLGGPKVNFKELSEASGIRYETVRNYVKVLIEEGLIDEVNEEVVEVVKKMPSFTSQGLTVVEAAHRATGKADSKSSLSEEGSELRERVHTLQEENEQLRRELQEERSLTKYLKENLASFEDHTKNSSGITVYGKEASTAADALKSAVKSAGSGFLQFLKWLFDTEEKETAERNDQ